ncbi:hypothetical protein BH09DEP1_BH09DEP1_1280 [soil metagenome]
MRKLLGCSEQRQLNKTYLKIKEPDFYSGSFIRIVFYGATTIWFTLFLAQLAPNAVLEVALRRMCMHKLQQLLMRMPSPYES